ncbi:MAG TPA: M28 family peptidase, partial [Candidatus Lokiarchaeia archaeon]
MHCEENNAFNIIKRISFPRLVGSDGERKARKVISEELNKAGYDSIKREKFETGFYNLNFIRYLFLFTGILIVLLGILFYLNYLTTILIIFLMIIMIIKCRVVSSSKEVKLSKNEFKRYETENIYANLRSKNSKAKVILLGHYDSKGQTFSISLRKILFSNAIFGIIITMIIYFIFFSIKIFFNYIAFEFSLILLIVCITVGIITIINFFNKTNNMSNGACDNGSSVGILIELARYFKKNPMNNLDIIFLFPSSEEINLGGSKIFLNKHKNDLDKTDTYFINYDVIGTNGKLNLITDYGFPKKTS